MPEATSLITSAFVEAVNQLTTYKTGISSGTMQILADIRPLQKKALLADHGHGTRCVRRQLKRYAAQHRVFQVRCSRGAHDCKVVFANFRLPEKFVCRITFHDAGLDGGTAPRSQLWSE